MDKRIKFILLALVFIILIDVFLLFCFPGYTGPTTERVYMLDEIDCVGVGDINNSLQKWIIGNSVDSVS